MSRKPAVVAYDISNRKSAYRVRKILADHRLNGQKSVAECWLTAREAEQLFLQLVPHIHPNHEKLILAWLDKRRPVLSAHQGDRHGFESLHSPSHKWIKK